MNYITFVLYLVTVALTVLTNRGSGDRMHFAVQLYLIALVMLCSLGAMGVLRA